MTDKAYDQILEAMLTSTGEWVTLQEWNCEGAEYDAEGWLSKWGDRIGRGSAPLPCGGFVNLSSFCAIRVGNP